MKVAPPGGSLTFWSALWIVFALICVYLGIAKAAFLYFILAAMIGLPAIGMWLGIRWSGYFIAVVLVASIPFAMFAILIVDDTLSERVARAVRIFAAGYFAWISFLWARDEE